MKQKILFCYILLFVSVLSLNLYNWDKYKFVCINLEIVNSIDDIDTVDVRDNSNRPINTIGAKRELIDLFITGLYSLIIELGTYSTHELLSIINSIIALSEYFITREIKELVLDIIQTLLPSTPRFLTLFLMLIIGSGLTGALKIYPTLFSYLFFIPKTKVAPLVLRC